MNVAFPSVEVRADSFISAVYDIFRNQSFSVHDDHHDHGDGGVRDYDCDRDHENGHGHDDVYENDRGLLLVYLS